MLQAQGAEVIVDWLGASIQRIAEIPTLTPGQLRNGGVIVRADLLGGLRRELERRLVAWIADPEAFDTTPFADAVNLSPR